ncbi:MAG: F0F1 ATP synthase subunit B [Bacteroidales bacterium]|nr:F0F1 ATP synthase subunit B [Bacteroidales bacterium]
MSLITPDFGLLVWMTLIFGIVFFVLAKWGFPMITGMVDQRSERINASIAQAREAEKQFAEMADRQTALIEETRREQARILKEAADARDKLVADAKEQAREEASKLIQQARTQIAAEKESALRDVRAEVANLSVEVAEKVLREKLSTEDAQLKLIDKLVGEINVPKPN